ncbi:MAG: hypothetical protein IIU15_06175, partial [Treponema sp.]|nr:hypothetical protein [Treponema sp.]
KRNPVLSNFSTNFDTHIEIYDHDHFLSKGKDENGKLKGEWRCPKKAGNAVVGCRFFYKEAASAGDKNNYNAFWGTDGKVDLTGHTISGSFYGKSITTTLSEDYNTITFTIACKALYTDLGFLKYGYPFGKSGSYTLTFTRK